METRPRKTYAEVKREALDALAAFYEQPVELRDGEIPRHTMEQHSKLEGIAREKVDAALKEGIPVRQLAHQAHLPGVLVIKLASDPAQRRDAYEAEIENLRRTIRTIESYRGADIKTRWNQGNGEEKTNLAAEFGVTRPTLDAWIRLAHEAD
ncbi:MAG TPA: hypothetical protein VHX38_02555 [Pseudonocardiaceae bacterium]|jgi:hypothetical protein|nr:hypothetical protein [Pseudonocardiaceae bacterium]